MILTAELIFTILMFAVEKHRATFMAPLGIGMALFLAHIIDNGPDVQQVEVLKLIKFIAGVNFAGASLNPTRTLGPAVILGVFTTYYWICWAGPAIGSLSPLHSTNSSNFSSMRLPFESRQR
jgi:aquaporin related protein